MWMLWPSLEILCVFILQPFQILPSHMIRFNGQISESSLGNMGRNYLIDFYATNLSFSASYGDASANPLELISLRDVYFNENLSNDTTNRGNLRQIHILIATGIIFMLLSIVNFTNLFVAKATSRAGRQGYKKFAAPRKDH